MSALLLLTKATSGVFLRADLGAAASPPPSYDLAFEKNRAAASSLPACVRPPPQREYERKDRPPFEEKRRDVQPPSFEFTQRSKEGDRDVAPPSPPMGDKDVAPPYGEIRIF